MKLIRIKIIDAGAADIPGTFLGQGESSTEVVCSGELI
jgi:hypothetical protein